MKTFGSVLKGLWNRAGLTQAELAAATGYKSAEAIRQIETDRRNADPERLPRIAEALRTDPRALTILALRSTFPKATAAIAGEPDELTTLPVEISETPVLQPSRAAREVALLFDRLSSSDEDTVIAVIYHLLDPASSSRLGRCA